MATLAAPRTNDGDYALLDLMSRRLATLGSEDDSGASATALGEKVQQRRPNLEKNALLDVGLKHDRFLPLPRGLLAQKRAVHSASYMGILSEINTVWLSVDNALYLWDYTQQGDDSFVRVGGFIDSDVIVSVALCTPRAGIFQPSIAYLLCVATLREVCLFAIAVSPGKTDDWRLLRTAYRAPTEGVVYRCVGSPSGIVFLAGTDGSLAELVYSATSSLWVLLSPGTWLGTNAHLQSSNGRGLPGADEGLLGQHKCHIKRLGAWDLRLSRFLPTFLALPTRALGDEKVLADLVVDSSHGLLYALSSTATLAGCAMQTSTRESGGTAELATEVGPVGSVIDVLAACAAWARGRPDREQLWAVATAAVSREHPLRAVCLSALPVTDVAAPHVRRAREGVERL